jgi:hypothetical protein
VKRLDYWIGVLVLAAAILARALFPRYELVTVEGCVFRMDRWTGSPVSVSLTLKDRPCDFRTPEY